MSTCRSCGSEIPATQTVCASCGTPVEPVRGSEGARWAGRAPDRRTVTVLFADLSGFTRMGERLDPEDLSDALKECLGELMDEVLAHGGWLEKNVGDAILGIFGAPVAHEDDPARAVRAAVSMRARFPSIVERLGENVRGLGLHIGVNTGLVVMDRHRGSEELMVIGDAVNIGKRLEEAAQPGQILVGERTHAATADAFAYAAVPPLPLKGRGERLAAYECLARAPTAPPTLDRAIAAPLVGRDQEVETLADALERLQGGTGGIVSVVGEAGVGKSRLVAEVRKIAEDRGIRWLKARALPYGESFGFEPFVELTRLAASISVDEDDSDAFAKLETLAAGLFEEDRDEVLPYLGTLLRLPVPGRLAERVRFLSSDAMRRQIFRASWRLFERLAAEYPLVVELEDWHWADRSSEELLEHLLPLVDSAPLALCFTLRPDVGDAAARLRSLPAAERAQWQIELSLQPLDEREHERLVDELLAPARVPPRFSAALFARTEGNPFFVEEVLRVLVDDGAIAREPETERWVIAPAVSEAPIPETIRGVLASRIDRLNDAQRDTLRVGAVIGRSFSEPVLGAVVADRDGVNRTLDELVQLELIYPKPATGATYVFKHALVQEVAYEGILLSERRDLHRRIVDALVRIGGDRLEDDAGVAAYHAAKAEDWPRAHEFLLRAGDQAGEVAADAEALQHYRQAADAYARAHGESWSSEERAELERKIGEALYSRGDNEDALACFERSLILLGRPLPTRRWRTRADIAARLLRLTLPRRVRFVPTAQADRRAVELTRLLRDAAWIDYFVNQERALLELLLTLGIAERNGLAEPAVTSYLGLGIVCRDIVGSVGLADRFFRRALAAGEESDDLVARGEGLLAHGLGTHAHGRWRDALAIRREAAAVFWQAGDVRRWGAAFLGASLIGANTTAEESIAQARTIVRVGTEGADDQLLGWGLQSLARALWESGELNEAAAAAERAVVLLEKVPDHMVMVRAQGDLGECHLRRGDLEAALVVLDDAAATIDGLALKGVLCTQPYLSRAAAYLLAAERGERPLADAETACKAALRQAKVDPEARAPAFRLFGTYEWLSRRTDRAERWWGRSADVAAALGSELDSELTRHEAESRTA